MSDALATVLGDALPRTGSAYAIGFSGEARSTLSEVLGESDVQFVDDASALGAPRDVVVAGPDWEAAFSGHPEAGFGARLTRLTAALNPGGSLAVLVPNLMSTADLLVAKPRRHASGDLDGGGYDPSRPASPAALLEEFAGAGHPAAAVHEIYGVDSRWCVLNPEAAALSRTSAVVTRAVSRALSPAAGHRARAVMPAELLVERLSAGGALHTAASQFLVVSGGRARALYAATDTGEVQWLDGSRHDSSWIVGGPSQDIDRPTKIPSAPSAEGALLRAVAASDTARFRTIAERLSHWVSTSSSLDHRTDLDWRDAVMPNEDLAQPEGGGSFTLALDLSGTSGADASEHGTDEDGVPSGSRDVLVAKAWRTFARRVRFLEADLPWPETFSDDELLRLWLSMCGVSEERAGELVTLTSPAGSPGGALSAPVGEEDTYSQRVAFEAAAARIVALEDEITALHETLKARDGELAVRARAIRSLRGQVLSASRNRELMAKANEDIKNSAAFKLANQFRRAALITRPKKLARSVGKAADRRVRALRRAS